jgi:ribonuclease E
VTEIAAEPAGEAAPQAQALDITPIEIVFAPPPGEGIAQNEPVAAAPVEMAEAEADETEALPAEAGQSDETEQTAESGQEEFSQGESGQEDSGQEDSGQDESGPEAPPPESLGGDGDDAAEARERRQRQRFLRNYKIQEVIHRRQIMLIQVVKEERGNKGAALTTYLSLAGRFSVLMPNSPSGGGVSRKITSVADRRRLKEAMAELDVPQAWG